MLHFDFTFRAVSNSTALFIYVPGIYPLDIWISVGISIRSIEIRSLSHLDYVLLTLFGIQSSQELPRAPKSQLNAVQRACDNSCVGGCFIQFFLSFGFSFFQPCLPMTKGRKMTKNLNSWRNGWSNDTPLPDRTASQTLFDRWISKLRKNSLFYPLKNLRNIFQL